MCKGEFTMFFMTEKLKKRVDVYKRQITEAVHSDLYYF